MHYTSPSWRFKLNFEYTSSIFKTSYEAIVSLLQPRHCSPVEVAIARRRTEREQSFPRSAAALASASASAPLSSAVRSFIGTRKQKCCCAKPSKCTHQNAGTVHSCVYINYRYVDYSFMDTTCFNFREVFCA